MKELKETRPYASPSVECYELDMELCSAVSQNSQLQDLITHDLIDDGI